MQGVQQQKPTQAKRSSSSCNCSYCSNSSSLSQPQPPQNQRYLTTDAYLLKLNYNQRARCLAPLQEFFTEGYRQRKGKNYLQAAEASQGALSAAFGKDSKIRQYKGFSIKSYPLAQYRYNPEHRDKLA